MRVRESALLFGASLYAGTTMVALMSAAALPADLREDMPSPSSPMAAPKQATRARANSRTLNRVVDTPRSLACSPASNGVHPGGGVSRDPRCLWRLYTEKETMLAVKAWRGEAATVRNVGMSRMISSTSRAVSIAREGKRWFPAECVTWPATTGEACVQVGFGDLDPPREQTVAHICVANHVGCIHGAQPCLCGLHSWCIAVSMHGEPSGTSPNIHGLPSVAPHHHSFRSGA